MRRGWGLYHRYIFSFLENLRVKESWKLVINLPKLRLQAYICQGYDYKSSVLFSFQTSIACISKCAGLASCSTRAGHFGDKHFQAINSTGTENRHLIKFYMQPPCLWWHSSAMGRALDLRSVGCGFKFYSRQRCGTTLGKLFTPMCLCHQAV